MNITTTGKMPRRKKTERKKRLNSLMQAKMSKNNSTVYLLYNNKTLRFDKSKNAKCDLYVHFHNIRTASIFTNGFANYYWKDHFRIIRTRVLSPEHLGSTGALVSLIKPFFFSGYFFFFFFFFDKTKKKKLHGKKLLDQIWWIGDKSQSLVQRVYKVRKKLEWFADIKSMLLNYGDEYCAQHGQEGVKWVPFADSDLKVLTPSHSNYDVVIYNYWNQQFEVSAKNKDKPVYQPLFWRHDVGSYVTAPQMLLTWPVELELSAEEKNERIIRMRKSKQQQETLAIPQNLNLLFKFAT
ncbi:hypothetical protein RFI_27297 [Reticulomyxa filosa]|uniref:Uncharacterized protein n=1 Tax=Reticulomyxa filosa TaxID=46433 RepID=X6M8U1_RETFI|nr:hypothetical protein RFI_27297 [Reticulomyxa filosa]|eukprot:ETO10081.1 hypothetical protein RFI_27297 [Reticulomyxa filosa]